MIRFVVRRLLWTVPTLFVISFLVSGKETTSAWMGD